MQLPHDHPEDCKEIFSHRSVMESLSRRLSFSPQKVKKLSKYHREQMESKRRIQLQEPLKQFIVTSASSKLEALVLEDKMMVLSSKSKLNDMQVPADYESPYSHTMAFPVIDSHQATVKSDAFRKRGQSQATMSLKSSDRTDRNSGRTDKPNQNLLPPSISMSTTNKQLPRLPTRFLEEEMLSPHSKSIAKLTLNRHLATKLFFPPQTPPWEYWESNRENTKQDAVLRIEGKKILTAKSYLVLDLRDLRVIANFNSEKPMEIASLTKIMTCYLCLLACKKYSIDIAAHTYRVPDKFVGTPGTSAELQAGDILTIEELLYGLMLPSGNDASLCLAEAVGKIMYRNCLKHNGKVYHELFIEGMNLISKELQLKQEWGNCSGLPASPNFSTARAICCLTAIALTNSVFERIVSTREVTFNIKNDRYGLHRKQTWKNTNRLLWKGFDGVKTGTTQTAGHCLISRRGNLLLGVFDCQTLSRRFSETVRLYQYCRDHMPQ